MKLNFKILFILIFSYCITSLFVFNNSKIINPLTFISSFSEKPLTLDIKNSSENTFTVLNDKEFLSTRTNDYLTFNDIDSNIYFVTIDIRSISSYQSTGSLSYSYGDVTNNLDILLKPGKNKIFLPLNLKRVDTLKIHFTNNSHVLTDCADITLNNVLNITVSFFMVFLLISFIIYLFLFKWLYIQKILSLLENIALDVYVYLRKNPMVFILGILLTIMCFGFESTNFTLSIDEELEIYRGGNNFRRLALGRIFQYLFNKTITFNEVFTPFYATAVASLLLLLAGFFWCFLFSEIHITNNNSQISSIVFIGLFLSLPFVVSEYMIFSIVIIENTLGLIIAPIILCIWKKNSSNYFLTIFLTIILISTYQTLLFYLILGYFFLQFLGLLSNNNNVEFCKNLFKDIVRFLSTISAAVLIYVSAYVIFFGIDDYFLKIPPKSLTLFDALSNNIINIFNFLIKSDFWGMTSVRFAYCILFLIILKKCIVEIKSKSKFISIFFTLVLGTVIGIMPFIMQIYSPVPFRSLFVLQLFVPTIFFTFIRSFETKDKLFYATCILSSFLIVTQIQMLNKLFYSDHVRYRIDQRLAENIMKDVEEVCLDYRTKPIIFYGSLPQNENPLIHTTSIIGTSYFQYDGGNPIRIVAFLNTEGYNLMSPLYFEYYENIEQTKNMPSWPKNGSIIDTGECIIIKLSEPPYIDGSLLKSRGQMF